MDELIKLTLEGNVLLQFQSNQGPILAVAVFDWLFDLVGDSFKNVLHFFIFVFMVIIKTAFFSALTIGIVALFFCGIYGMITGKLRGISLCPHCGEKVKKSKGKCPHCHGYYDKAEFSVERTDQPPE